MNEEKELEKSIQDRGLKLDLSRLTKLAESRGSLRQEVEGFRAERNKLGLKDRKRGEEIKKKLKKLEPELEAVEAEFSALSWKLPNLVHPTVPRGGEDKNKVLHTVGKPEKFDFKPADHEEIAERLDLIDFKAGAKVAGSKFYFLKNEAALLEFALIKYAFDLLLKEGFTPFVTPDLAKRQIIDGIGFSPRGPESNVYLVEGEDLGLVGTAEITLGGYHADEVLENLPLKYAGFSHCFRREAGGYGQYAKGLYRVHQFSKVEMFVFCEPKDSEKTHAYLLELEEKLFQGLKIPYRVVDIASGELGAAAYRKFDLEAWLPGRGEWGEITSTSNTTDYQAKRLNIRYKTPQGKPEFVHTLNGTAIATSRALVAILENYQQKDGSVEVPEVLVPYVGKRIISPRA